MKEEISLQMFAVKKEKEPRTHCCGLCFDRKG